MFRLEVAIPQRYRLAFDKKRVRKVLQRAGAEIAAVARRKIRTSAGTGRVYRGHRASAPGQPPVSLSGALAGSIRARPYRGGDGVTISDAAVYARFLETGAKGGGGSRGGRGTSRRRPKLVVGNRVMEARPFLSTALEERASSIAQRMKAAIVEDVEFVRIAAGK